MGIMEGVQPSHSESNGGGGALRSSKRNGAILNLLYSNSTNLTTRSTRSNSITEASPNPLLHLQHPLESLGGSRSRNSMRVLPTTISTPCPHLRATPSSLNSRSFSTESTPGLPSRALTAPSTTSVSHRPPLKNQPPPQRASPCYRHTVYHPRIKVSGPNGAGAGYEEQQRGILRDLEKLRVDLPRQSFETDTDSDYHSLLDNSNTFNTDDLTDISSTATSEVRHSTDSLTPSEVDLASRDYTAEMSLEEALSASTTDLYLGGSPPLASPESGPMVASPDSGRVSEGLGSAESPISSSNTEGPALMKEAPSPSPSNGPPKVKPLPPKEEEDPKIYLKYLEDTFSKDELGSLLAKNDGFHSQVLDVFMENIEFKNVSIDMALRSLVSVLYLPKEGQQIDRIISVFSKRYYLANVDLFESEDVVYSLSFSLLLLHTDAHNKLVKHKMTKDEYIKQTRQLDNAASIPVEILEVLYDNITHVEFFRNDELMPQDSSSSISGESKRSWYKKLHDSGPLGKSGSSIFVNQNISAIKVSTLFNGFQPERSPYSYLAQGSQYSQNLIQSPFVMRVKGLQTFFQQSPKLRPTSGFSIASVDEHSDVSELRCLKEGLLLRKSDIGEAGRKTHLRAWREFWVVLAGSQLLLFKEVSAMRMRHKMKNREQIPAPKPYSIISVANVIAVVDHEYTKHLNAFRFVTSDGRQYLFRGHSPPDRTEWMSKINYTAAFKSTDVLPRNVPPQAFLSWRNALPQLHSFDFEANDDEQVRARVIQAKLNQLDQQFIMTELRLKSEVHLLHQLGVMVVFTKSTRDRVITVIEGVRIRLRRIHLDRQRLLCYKDILLSDLEYINNRVTPAPSPNSSSPSTKNPSPLINKARLPITITEAVDLPLPLSSSPSPNVPPSSSIN